MKLQSKPNQIIFFTMGNSRDKNKGRKSALGKHLTKRSLGKWLIYWQLRNFFVQKLT